VGGLSPSNYGASVPRWGTAPPAVNEKDDHLVDEVLCADMVWFTGGPAYQWDSADVRYRINHPRVGNSQLPDAQNVLFGDGHVETKGREYYPTALTTSNYSLEFCAAPVGGFFYWGPTLSSTALGFQITYDPGTTTPTSPTGSGGSSPTSSTGGTTSGGTTTAPPPQIPTPIPGGGGLGS